MSKNYQFPNHKALLLTLFGAFNLLLWFVLHNEPSDGRFFMIAQQIALLAAGLLFTGLGLYGIYRSSRRNK